MPSIACKSPADVIFHSPPTQCTEISLQQLLDEIRTDIESTAPETAVEISADATELGTIRTDPSLFVLVIKTLAESTLTHNESPTPAIEIAVRRATVEREAIEISIRDNGTGIPESELAPLRNGSENPLEHGSGVSLWIVYWGVRVLGGELSFESQSTGTTATVSLPQQREPEPEQSTDESERREPQTDSPDGVDRAVAHCRVYVSTDVNMIFTVRSCSRRWERYPHEYVGCHSHSSGNWRSTYGSRGSESAHNSSNRSRPNWTAESVSETNMAVVSVTEPWSDGSVVRSP